MKKIFFVLILTVVFFSSCANLLVSEPKGSQLSEQQAQASMRELDARINGLYYAMIKSPYFTYLGGQKYIDVYTDILVSDAATPSLNWGFFEEAAFLLGNGQAETFNNTLWAYEYANIRNANLLIKRCNEVLASEATTDEIKTKVNIILGQAYAMRGYYYYQLTNFWTDPATVSANTEIIPYYDETNMGQVQPLSSYNTIIAKAIADLDKAIGLLASFERSAAQKGYVDANVAKMIQANIRLNKGRIFDLTTTVAECTEALKLVEEVIATNKFEVLPYAQVLTDGFNSIKSKNWIWGMDVVPENSRQINSFWSMVDIYTYGYASAGEYIALDDSIYKHFNNLLSANDIRKQWWRAGTTSSQFSRAPINKFFDSNKVIQGDRVWTNDLVMMRIEEAHLIAAEAAFVLGDEAKAREHLKVLVNQRDPDYVSSIDALTGEDLKNYIINNWRIELWLEGKSFMAMKRFGWKHNRGSNHYVYEGSAIDLSLPIFVFEFPTGEQYYNPYIVVN